MSSNWHSGNINNSSFRIFLCLSVVEMRSGEAFISRTVVTHLLLEIATRSQMPEFNVCFNIRRHFIHLLLRRQTDGGAILNSVCATLLLEMDQC